MTQIDEITAISTWLATKYGINWMGNITTAKPKLSVYAKSVSQDVKAWFLFVSRVKEEKVVEGIGGHTHDEVARSNVLYVDSSCRYIGEASCSQL